MWNSPATAELQIGSAALRMKTASSLEFLNLDDSNVQLRLTEGSLIIRLRYLGDQDSFEVDTPNLAFTLLRPANIGSTSSPTPPPLS